MHNLALKCFILKDVSQIKPWKMEADDTVLLDLLPFLEAVWSTNVPDVRNVVRSYHGQDIPSAFRSAHREHHEQCIPARCKSHGSLSRQLLILQMRLVVPPVPSCPCRDAHCSSLCGFLSGIGFVNT